MSRGASGRAGGSGAARPPGPPPSDLRRRRTQAMRDAIERALAEGALKACQVTERTGLSRTQVAYQMRRMGLRFPVGHRQRIEVRLEVEAAVAWGARSASEVASDVCLPLPRARALLAQASIRLPLEGRMRQEARAIEAAVRHGAESLGAIADRVGLLPAAVLACAERYDIRLPHPPPGDPQVDPDREARLRARRQSQCAAIRAAIAAGAASKLAVAQRVGMPGFILRQICREEGIVLPGWRPRRKEWPQLAELAQRGLTLVEIARECHITRERVRQLLHAHGLHRAWRQRRRARRLACEQMQRFLGLLNARALDLASRQGWAWRTAMGDWLEHHRGNHVDLPRVVRFCAAYEKTRAAGSPLHVRTLARTAGVTDVTARRLLDRMRLEMPPGTMSKLQRAAIERARTTRLSATDVAQALGLQPEAVSHHMRPRQRVRNLSSDVPRTTYWLAGQIFEARDLGFSPGAIAVLLDVDELQVRKVLELRPAIAAVIVAGLDALDPGVRHRKPYLHQLSGAAAGGAASATAARAKR